MDPPTESFAGVYKTLSFYVTWLYANMFGESINKLKLKLKFSPG